MLVLALPQRRFAACCVRGLAVVSLPVEPHICAGLQRVVMEFWMLCLVNNIANAGVW